ncbi:helix-turn-helix transcriptional regulator, partial [Saccharomonospora saliphila]|uniref:helix-turn-helix transcriptional regulator n=1 Tax=Saccharomonospora saliphila TaxID=369829 RepID=UPI0018DB48DB
AAATARSGDRAEAVRVLERAHELGARCGADRETARVQRRLRTLGARGRSTPATGAATGWASLTESELRVSRLVAEGLTNRATARRLFLSPHTVDTHLRHIFAKLGVSSRVELVRLALRHEGGGNHEKT